MFKSTFTVILVFTILFVYPVYAQEFVTDGLIGFWPLDSSTIDGGTVTDVFGENDGDAQGNPAKADGVINEGLEFDGAGARVELPKELMVGLESFTIECWFNYTDSGNWRWMFGGGPEWNHGVGCCIYSGSNIVRYHLKTDGGEFTDGNGSTALDPGEWYHIAYTYDGEMVRSYVNGEIDFERAHQGAVVIDTSVLAIGGGYFQNNEYFLGLLDEVRVYDRALEQDEVQKNMEATSNSMAVEPLDKLYETWGEIKTR
ncbi:hypothetical protein GF312_05865 [Candidatus Poribacteria bacterium]|nr:hypothetical protein [Candidatus Poribacteria bacterium]